MTKVNLEQQFWGGGGWNTHEALHTVSHGHIDVYNGDPNRDDLSLRIVKTSDGKFFIERESVPEKYVFENVFDTDDKNGVVWLYDALPEVLEAAIKVASEVSGDSYEKLFDMYGDMQI